MFTEVHEQTEQDHQRTPVVPQNVVAQPYPLMAVQASTHPDGTTVTVRVGRVVGWIAVRSTWWPVVWTNGATETWTEMWADGGARALDLFAADATPEAAERAVRETVRRARGNRPPGETSIGE
jgi:hypothetical protein